MPLPRWLTVVAVATTAALLAGVLSSPASIAAPALGLCTTDPTRGSVPASFPIEGCLDTAGVWLHNTLKVPIMIGTTGDTSPPVTVTPDLSLAAVATRARFNDSRLLLPGDLMRVPVGPQQAAVELANVQAGGFYILAVTLASFLPGGTAKASYDAFTQMLADMSEAILAREGCRATKSWIEQSACDVMLVGQLAKALAVGATTGLAKGALAVVFSTKLWADVVAAQVPDITRITKGDRAIRVHARPQPAGSAKPGQGSGPPSASPSSSCGSVSFQAGTEYGAYDITGTGVDCATARAVVAGSRANGGGNYTAAGFSCLGTAESEPGYPTVNYVCSAGDRQVRFRFAP